MQINLISANIFPWIKEEGEMAKIYSILSKIKTSDNNIFPFVKLRFRSRTGEGQVKVRLRSGEGQEAQN